MKLKTFKYTVKNFAPNLTQKFVLLIFFITQTSLSGNKTNVFSKQRIPIIFNEQT